MKRIFSGVQATGLMHIGNYLGAIKPWAQLQGGDETIYFIPDLHTLNVRPKPEELRQNTLSTVAWLMAAGIDPHRSTIFAQSRVHAHAELGVILENFATLGELNRMTQYKDKASKRSAEGQLVMLYTYPVLMTADILLYDATHVPTGEDQKQHVELARDIAERFNNLYGQTFIVPEPMVGTVAARVMSLQDPESKMSKSDADQSGNVMLLDEPDLIRRKLSRAITDSGSAIEATDDKPAMTNLLQIYAGFTGESVEAIVARYAGEGYGKFKSDLAEVIVAEVEPLRARYNELMSDPEHILTVIGEGSAKASNIADAKVKVVKQKLGLV